MQTTTGEQETGDMVAAKGSVRGRCIRMDDVTVDEDEGVAYANRDEEGGGLFAQ